MPRRSRHDPIPSDQLPAVIPSTTSDKGSDVAPKPDSVPAHVWTTLQAAGERAADKLLDMLSSKKFDRLRPSEQARLVELALNRAYGPPIKREMSLTLTGNVSDAVAASLATLSATDLPEMAGRSRPANKPKAI